jgi:hypothetical protein
LMKCNLSETEMKYWPVSTPSIQISGDITKSILHFVCKQWATWSQIRRTWGLWKNRCMAD